MAKVIVLQTFPASESRVTMAWLISIFGTSSTSAVVTNFPSARASASCPTEGLANAVVGGWSINWSCHPAGGQPITIPCPTATAAGTSCHAHRHWTNPIDALGLHNVTQFLNPGAFNQPCVLGAGGASTAAASGMHSFDRPWLPWVAIRRRLPDQDFIRLDFSIFKDFQLTERFTLAVPFRVLQHSQPPELQRSGISAATVLSRSAGRPTTPVRTLEKLGLLAMLRTIRDRSSSR